MTREQLDKGCEKGILFLVLVILVFGPLATGAVRPLEFLIIQGLTIVAVLFCTLRFWLNPGHRLLWPPICWAVVGFVVLAIIRYQTADLEYVARQELIRILVYALLFFVILNNLARQETTQLISCVMIFLGMAISSYAIYQFATHSQYVWHFIKPAAYRNRGSGTYICPNHLAGFLEMLLPLGLTYTVTARLGHVLRVFLSYASLLILAGIAVTVSRGGWVAAGMALLIFCGLLIRGNQYRIPALIVLVLLALGGTVFYFNARQPQQRIKEMFATDNPQESARLRFSLAKPAVKMWLEHFWFGVGPAHFDYRFPAYRPPEVQARPGHAHNDYLNTLADWGVVGTAMVLSAWVLLYAGVLRTWKFVRRERSDLGTRPGNRAAFVSGAAIGLVAILIHSFFDFNLHIPANAIVVVSLMALLAGYLRYATEGYWLNVRWQGTILLTGLGLAGIIYLGGQGWRRVREYAWQDRAGREKTYSPTLIAALRKAAGVEPTNFETTYALGEALRRSGWDDISRGETFLKEAIEWFKRGVRLNPADPYNYMSIGMCLDRLGDHAEAAPFFKQAVDRDPNNYYVLDHQGWHFVQVNDYATAKTWFERSLRMKWIDNPTAYSYLGIIERKLKETPAPTAR